VSVGGASGLPHHFLSLEQTGKNRSLCALTADSRHQFDWVSQNQKQIRD
jgi:hypothetical protein